MSEQDVESALLSKDPEQRRLAVTRISQNPGPESARLLIVALGDEDWRVRKEAVGVTPSLAPVADVVEQLVTALTSRDNVGLRNAVVDALAGLGVRAVQAVATRIQTLDEDARKLSAEVLGRSGHPAALGALQVLARDPDTNVRATAVEAIGEIGLNYPEQAVPVLEASLSNPDNFTRLCALDGLNRLGATLSWSRLAPLLDDPALERAVMRAAGRTHVKGALDALVNEVKRARGTGLIAAVQGLADFVRGDPERAALATAAFGSVDSETISRILALLDSEIEDVRRAALLVTGTLPSEQAEASVVTALTDDGLAPIAQEALELMGERALDALLLGASRFEGHARAVCVSTMPSFVTPAAWPRVAPLLESMLRDGSEEARRAALAVVATTGDAGFVPWVAALVVADVSLTLRRAAENALSALCERFPAEAQALVSDPGGPGALSGVVAVSVLGRSASDPDRYVDFLAGAMLNSSPWVRRKALAALGSLGCSRSLESIVLALTDEEVEVRLAAAQALGKIRDSDDKALGVDALVDLCRRSSDGLLVCAALRALGQTGDIQALAVLTESARSSEPSVAVAAVESLMILGGEGALGALIEAVSHPHAEVVKGVLPALAESRDPRALAHLGACLDHEAWDVRRLSADLLGQVGAESSVPLLRARLSLESSPLVREAIHRALEGFGAWQRSLMPPSEGSGRG
jgi:HEAT repeat protein